MSIFVRGNIFLYFPLSAKIDVLYSPQDPNVKIYGTEWTQYHAVIPFVKLANDDQRHRNTERCFPKSFAVVLCHPSQNRESNVVNWMILWKYFGFSIGLTEPRPGTTTQGKEVKV